jgi:uncharacterized protein
MARLRFCLIQVVLLLALTACGTVSHLEAVTLGIGSAKKRTPESSSAAAAKASLRTKQFSAALRELHAGAERGDTQSEYLLGLVYANGLGTEISLKDARRWLKVAAEKSHADAAYALAGLLAQGSEKDRKEAQHWLERAAADEQPFAVKLVATGTLPLAPVRNSASPRELLIWSIQHHVESVEVFARASGVEAEDEFGRSPLSYAVTHGSEPAVKTLLSLGASGDHADHFGVTPLMLAAEASDDAVLDELLTHGATSINVRDKVGNSALFYAARLGRARHVARLLTAGASLNGANADGWTVLDVSAKSGHVETAKLLRDAGATANLKVSRIQDATGIDATQTGELYEGWPPLAIAASRDDVGVVEKLLSEGARPDEPTPQGDTPLLVAAKFHAAKVVAPLTKAGAEAAESIEYASAHGPLEMLDALLQRGVSPPSLTGAARLGDLVALKHLIDAGADVNLPDGAATTPMMVAAAAANVEVMQVLLAAGKARLVLTDHMGRNALWFAAGSGSNAIVDMLLAAGSPLGEPSPLFAAVQAGKSDAVEHLLRKGLPPDPRSFADDTPLMAAASRGDTQVVRVLLDGGAALDAQNERGDTALMQAVRAGQTDVCKILLAAGADTGLHNHERVDALETARRRHLTEIVAMLESH